MTKTNPELTVDEVPAKKKFSGMLRLARVVLEIAAIVVFIFVLRQNAALRRYVAAKRPAATVTKFSAADQWPVFNVVNRDGKRLPLKIGAERKLLFIADPGCGTCEEHLPLLPADTVVLSVADYTSTRSSPLFRFPGQLYALAERPRDRRLGRVPQFLVVESQRVVKTCADSRDCR